ncbi:glycosyltransferase [Vibrio fluvialis]|nr:glycosyltransferase [Vibrio fluvialis]
MNILYILSTLKNSGPVNQLFNVVESNVKSCDITILTLSSETNDSRIQDFRSIGAKCYSLNLNRFEGVLLAKSKIKKEIQRIKPDIVHSQGIRADGLLSKLKLNCPWVVTAHNYPKEDYPMKFGWIKGNIMSKCHLKYLSKCNNLISCSKSINQQLSNHSINSIAIQNGVKILDKEQDFKRNESPVFITIGSLIPRKNMSYIISSFNSYSKSNDGKLIVLGDGPLMNDLKLLAKSNDSIKFLGNVNNVHHFLNESDVFISSSLSEGLPNTVLEALSSGLNCFLSNIPSHREIGDEFNSSVHIFDIESDVENNQLIKLMKDFENIRTESSYMEAIETSKLTFSAKFMSNKYFDFYKGLLKQ